MLVNIIFLSISLELSSSSSAHQVVVAVDFADLVHPGLVVVVRVFSDHLLVVAIVVGLVDERRVDLHSA